MVDTCWYCKCWVTMNENTGWSCRWCVIIPSKNWYHFSADNPWGCTNDGKTNMNKMIHKWSPHKNGSFSIQCVVSWFEGTQVIEIWYTDIRICPPSWSLIKSHQYLVTISHPWKSWKKREERKTRQPLSLTATRPRPWNCPLGPWQELISTKNWIEPFWRGQWDLLGSISCVKPACHVQECHGMPTN